MEELNRENAQEALAKLDGSGLALAVTLTHAAEEYVYGIHELMKLIGAPRDFAIARIFDTALLKTENAYGPVSREEWIKIWDDNAELREFLRSNQDLLQPVRDKIVEFHTAPEPEPEPVLEPEPEPETVQEKAKRRAFGIDLSDLDEL